MFRAQFQIDFFFSLCLVFFDRMLVIGRKITSIFHMFKEETLHHKIINKWSWIYIFTILWAPLLYLVRVMLSHSIPIADFGVIYSVIWIIFLTLTFSSAGLSPAMKFFLPKHYINNEISQAHNLIRQNLLMRMVISWILIVFTLLFSEQIALWYFGSLQYKSILIPMLLCLIWFGILDTVRAYFEAIQNIKTNQLIEFLRKFFVSLWVWLLFIVWSTTVTAYARAWWIWIVLTALISVILLYQSEPTILKTMNIYRDKIYNSKYFSFGVVATIWSSAILVLNQIDQQMVILFLGWEDAWLYSNYVSLMMMSVYLIGPLLGYLFPIISEIYVKQQTKKLSLLIEYFYNILLLFIALLWVYFMVYGTKVATVLYGSQYMLSWEMFSIVAPFIITNILFSLNFAVMMGVWDSTARTKIIRYALLINIILNTLLIPLFGMRWAIIATVTAWTIMSVLSTRYVHSLCPIKVHRKAHSKHLLLFIGLYFLWTYTYDFIPRSSMSAINFLILIVIWWCFAGSVLLLNWEKSTAFYKTLLRGK